MATVEGTIKDDQIDGSYTGDPQGDVPTSGDDEITGGIGYDTIEAGCGDDTVFGGEHGDKIWGEGGDDRLYGDQGEDLLFGGDGDDVLFGGEGNDTLKGNDGDDTLVGGAGIDQMGGGADADILIAGAGDYADGGYEGNDDDTLDLSGVGPYRFENVTTDFDGNGQDGTVVLLNAAGDPTGETIEFRNIEHFVGCDGPSGPDGTVEGTAGDDLIDRNYTGDPDGDMIDNGDAILPGAAPDDDLVYGYGGDDTIIAGKGSDEVYGGDGDDVIDTRGEDGLLDLNDKFDNPYPPLPADAAPDDDHDTVYGGEGDDVITTGDDADTIYGGTGDDSIDAGIDDDYVQGDGGDDTIIGGEGNDIIFGGDGDDVIYGGLSPAYPDGLNIPDDAGDLVTDNGMDTIIAGDGDDTVFGMDDDDLIDGGAGNDYLDGGIDDDTVLGGAGDDTIIGGQGNDLLGGGDDRDLFIGGNGGDNVDGGGGGDDYDTLDLTGTDVDHITYTTPDHENGIVTFGDGSTMTFEEIENVIPCFTPGTMIATPRGERAVEELQEGDRIITRDNGIQEIRWTGRKDVTGRDLAGMPHLKPILIRAGALGNGLPERDMMVSPNHRLLVASDRTQLYFEESEVLAAAKHLVGLPGVQEVDVARTAYIHFMFDRHEVVLSNGAWTESFQPGDYTLKGIGNAQRTEILELFPELASKEGREGYTAARKALKKHEAQLLVR